MYFHEKGGTKNLAVQYKVINQNVQSEYKVIEGNYKYAGQEIQ